MSSHKQAFNTQSAHYRVYYPATALVSPEQDTAFTYVIRKDTAFVCNPIAEKIAKTQGLPAEEAKTVLSELYEVFTHGLTCILGQHFQQKGKTEIHIFDPDEIEHKQMGLLQDGPCVSLDPLITGKNVHVLGLSRCYFPGGIEEMGLIPRPGFPSLEEQISTLKKRIGDAPITILEDDVYTGGSLLRVVGALSKAGIHVQKIIPGIQIGAPSSLTQGGIIVEPVIRYSLSSGQDIDLGDPRDFLLGADGLVTNFGKGQIGRLPYVLPFVSPKERLSIPQHREGDFSREVLTLNREFFVGLEKETGICILPNHMNPFSIKALEKLVPEWKTLTMAQIAEETMKDTVSTKIVKSSQDHNTIAKIMALGMPKQLIFIDVNGTLIPQSCDGTIDKAELTAFKTAVEKLETQGVAVGLNSDSPLPQLLAFGQKIGLHSPPVLAENGALLHYKGETVTLRQFPDLSCVREAIMHSANQGGYLQNPDSIAIEFGGGPRPEGQNWAFGANRDHSISVFGPDALLRSAKEGAEALCKPGTISCDLSPENRFLGVHSGPDFRSGKRETLSLIAAGHEVTMVGDSLSDYAPAESSVKVVFVDTRNIPPEILSQPHVTATSGCILPGVIECLETFKIRPLPAPPTATARKLAP